MKFSVQLFAVSYHKISGIRDWERARLEENKKARLGAPPTRSPSSLLWPYDE